MARVRFRSHRKDFEQGFDAAARRALELAGEHVGAVSDAQTPIEEEILISSRAVTADEESVVISYDTPYAVVQHEDTTLRHDAGRTHHFLKNAMDTETREVLGILEDELGEAFRGGPR